MNSIIKSFVLTLLVGCITNAYAGSVCENCTVTSIGVGPHYDSVCTEVTCAFVMVTGNLQSKPACATENWTYVLNLSTDSGRASLAFLMTANVSGKPINISGNGICTLFATSEDFLYAHFSY